MKRKSSVLKVTARKNLTGKYGAVISCYLLLAVITAGSTMLITAMSARASISTFGVITSTLLNYMISLLISVVNAGYLKIMLNVNRNEEFSFRDLFYAFKNHPDRYIIVHLILLVIQFVITLPTEIMIYRSGDAPSTTALLYMAISMLFGAVATVVINLFFGLTDYLLIDHPEMGAMEALKTSLSLMKGNKGRLLYINLSFIPLSILCIFTCYVGFLWLIPYMQSTLTLFYMDVTGELDRPKVEPTENDPFNNYYNDSNNFTGF